MGFLHFSTLDRPNKQSASSSLHFFCIHATLPTDSVFQRAPHPLAQRKSSLLASNLNPIDGLQKRNLSPRTLLKCFLSDSTLGGNSVTLRLRQRTTGWLNLVG